MNIIKSFTFLLHVYVNQHADICFVKCEVQFFARGMHSVDGSGRSLRLINKHITLHLELALKHYTSTELMKSQTC